METSSAQITYRLYHENDIDALVQFWNEYSGWDQVNRHEWERRFMHTPFWPAAEAIATDKLNKEIIAQLILIPIIVQVDGTNRKAYQPFAMVVNPKQRTSGYLKLVDRINKMCLNAIDNFKQKNIRLVHMMPDPTCSGLLRFLPAIQIGSFSL